MAMETIKLGGYLDEEVKKINDNFAKCVETEDIPAVPSKVSDLTNDAGYQTAAQVTSAIGTATTNLVEKEAGKGLSTNDYTAAEKLKVANIGKIDFAASEFVNGSDGNKQATIAAAGKFPVKVMRENSGTYEEVLVHATVSGSNIVLVSAEAFAGYVVTV